MVGRLGPGGSLEPGKLADLAVLNTDPLTVEEIGIRDIKSLMTMVGGRIVRDAELVRLRSIEGILEAAGLIAPRNHSPPKQSKCGQVLPAD